MTTRSVTYCSFASETECLGVCVLDGTENPIEASAATWMRGINPGGELLCFVVDESEVPPDEFELLWNNRNRLIPASEARALFHAKSLREHEMEAN